MILQEKEREYEIKKIQDVLKRGLNKKIFLVQMSEDNNNTILVENKLSYDVKELSTALIDLIERYGQICYSSTDSLSKKIFLGSNEAKLCLDCQNDNTIDVVHHKFLNYPQVIECFLNSIEGDNERSSQIDNNSILVGFDEDTEIDSIYFDKMLNIDFENLDDYYMLKYIISLIDMDFVCKYKFSEENLDDRINSNNLLFNYIKKIDNADLIKGIVNNRKRVKIK